MASRPSLQANMASSLTVGISYDMDQYERLQGHQPALINVFKLKAIACKMRHRQQGIQFRKLRENSDLREGDQLSTQDVMGLEAPMIGPPAIAAKAGISKDTAPDEGANQPPGGIVVDGPNNLLGLYTIFCHPMCILLVCVPLGWLSPVLHWGVMASFWLNFFALVPLAKILGDATEELAASLNDAVSGLLNASFGNAVEMIVSVQALRKNLFSVVKLSLLGSILSNILLVLGTSFFLGGLTPSATVRSRAHSFLGQPGSIIGFQKEQKFPLKSALVSMALLLFSCMSFALPTMFDQYTDDQSTVVTVSRIASWLVASTYVAFLLFQLFTHKEFLLRDEGRNSAAQGPDQTMARVLSEFSDLAEQEGADDANNEDEDASLDPWCAVLLMAACTVVTAINSGILVGVLEQVVSTAGIPETFIGVILLPIAGNACEHAGAIRFAMVDRPGLAIGIAVGSSTQVALLVIPFTVIVGAFMDKPMDMNFGALNTLTVSFSVLVVLTLLLDGRSNWMKGYLLMALYTLCVILYWYVPFSTV